MGATADPLLAYRLAAVRVGVVATWWTLLALGAYGLLAGADLDRPLVYWAVVALTALGAAVIPTLPWGRLLTTGWGNVALYSWSVADIGLVSAGVAATGGVRSPMVLVYALTTIFFAASYRPRAQVVLLAITAVGFASAAATAPGFNTAALVVEMGVIAVLAYMGGFLSTRLQAATAAHEAARADAERRAEMLAAVASAAREISSLEPDAVLDAVMDALIAVGFDAADLCLIDSEEASYQVVHARNLPLDYTGRTHAASEGVVSRVLEHRQTVQADYGNLPGANELLQAAGFRAVVAVPVWEQGRLAAVLGAGVRSRTELNRDEVEAAELLASQAGRALENAHRFATERQMVEQLSDVNRLKREFLSVASHELRTPLTVITGMGQALERRWDVLDPVVRLDLLQRLNANTASLTRIVNQLLDHSRLETGGIATTVDVVDLRGVVHNVLHRMASLLDEHPLHVDLGDAVAVSGDPFLLDRVFENLLTNAARHTPPGTKVSITALTSERHVEVTVADDGPGISQDDLALIGSRFFRGSGESVTRSRGLGLGLAFVKEILELHGSSLHVVSTPGAGSAFSFRLPLGSDDRAEPASLPTAPAAAG